MSSLPQRKKTPEELAALRAQEFAPLSRLAPTDSPTPAAMPASPPLVQRDVTARPRPVDSLSEPLAASATEKIPPRPRKAAPMKHGNVQVFDGLRPKAALEPNTSSPGATAQIPHRKHDANELQQLRHRGLMQTRPPVQRILSMQLHPVSVALLYLFAIATIVQTLRHWSPEGMERFYYPVGGCGILLLTSLFLYFKKPRSRHHAAIISGMCFVVLGFIILFILKNPYAP